MLTCSEKLPSFKPHDPLIMWRTLSCMAIKKKILSQDLRTINLSWCLLMGGGLACECLSCCWLLNIFQMILLRWSTFLLGSLVLTLSFMLFWIDLFLLDLIFVLKWLLLHWEILIMLFYYWLSVKLKGGCPLSCQSLRIFQCWLGQSVSIWEMFQGRICLNSVPLLLLLNFVSWSRLEWMYISLIGNISHHYKYQGSYMFMVFSYLCCCHSS